MRDVDLDLDRRLLERLRGMTPEESADRFPYDEIAERILEMGRLAAERLDSTALADFRTRIETRRAREDHPVLREWLRLIDDGPHAVAAMLRDRTEFGRYMRAMAPLRGLVSREERAMFFTVHGPERDREAERRR